MTISKQLLLGILLVDTIHAAPDIITISGRCESIHRQKYLTLRLKRAMGLLRQMPAQQTRTLLHLDPSGFRHPTIIDTAIMIQKKGSLDPLFSSWESLVAFAHVDDPLFAREFTELVFAIQRQLVQRSTESKTKYVPSMSGLDALLTLDGTTYTEAMATRYYYAKRIERSMNMLKKIRCDRSIFFEKDSSDQFVPTSQYTFSHPEILHCIKEMNSQNSLSPLIWLYGSFEKMKCLPDEQFTKEFLLLNLAVQHNMGKHSTNKESLRKETTEEVTNIYRANINNLPIEKILETINMLGEELPPLIEQYELNNPDLTWKEWFRKNKWALPLMIAQLGVNVGWWLFQQKYSVPKYHRPHGQR